MKRKHLLAQCVAIVFQLLLCSHLSFGQTSGVITGKVLDSEDASPLPGANVLVKGTSLGASTDDQGRFRVSNIPPGTVTPRISYLGYETAEQQVSVSTGATSTLEIRLRPSALTVEGVTVTAQHDLPPEK